MTSTVRECRARRGGGTHKEEYLVLGEQHGGLAGGHDERAGGRDAQHPAERPQRRRHGHQVGAHERHQRRQRRGRGAPRARPAQQRRGAVWRDRHALLEELLHHLSPARNSHFITYSGLGIRDSTTHGDESLLN